MSASLKARRIASVETHRATVMRKLSVNTTAALIRYAIRNKLVEA